jgi:hypothetical protein
MIAVLLVISTVPGHADRGGHGAKGHAYGSHGDSSHRHRGHGHGGRHWSGGVRLFISPGFVVPLGSYWEPYPALPVVIARPPRVSIEAPPPQYWYYCEASQASYPSVQECPGGAAGDSDPP